MTMSVANTHVIHMTVISDTVREDQHLLKNIVKYQNK